MNVTLDINPACMKRLGAKPDDLSIFADINVDILRMDGAYDEDYNLVMLQNSQGMKIEYNASILAPRAVERLLMRGASRDRLLVCHNFYPQRYTGFRLDRFCEVNDELTALDIPIGAFVSSQMPGSHGVWDAKTGLPTVERLRFYPAELQARILAAGKATDILFGNAYASEQELYGVREALAPTRLMSGVSIEGIERNIELYDQKKVRVEPLYNLTEIEKTILFDFYPHMDMGDSSEWIWRSRLPRVRFANKPIVPRRYASEYFSRGDVVMVNDNYKHYAGEVQVVLQPIQNDGTRNLVARINEQELTMFDVISGSDTVLFLPPERVL
jgi:hypothetical protein